MLIKEIDSLLFNARSYSLSSVRIFQNVPTKSRSQMQRHGNFCGELAGIFSTCALVNDCHRWMRRCIEQVTVRYLWGHGARAVTINGNNWLQSFADRFSTRAVRTFCELQKSASIQNTKFFLLIFKKIPPKFLVYLYHEIYRGTLISNSWST